MSLYKTSRSDVVDHLHSTKYVKTKETCTNYIGSVVNYKISAGGRMDGWMAVLLSWQMHFNAIRVDRP